MNILKEQRLKHKKTQQQISKLLNISQAAYSKYENNKAEPDKESLKKLADYYNVTVDYLVERTEESFATYSNAQKSRLEEIYDSLPEQMQSQLITYADFLNQINEKLPQEEEKDA